MHRGQVALIYLLKNTYFKVGTNAGNYHCSFTRVEEVGGFRVFSNTYVENRSFKQAPLIVRLAKLPICCLKDE